MSKESSIAAVANEKLSATAAADYFRERAARAKIEEAWAIHPAEKHKIMMHGRLVETPRRRTVPTTTTRAG